MPRFCLFGHYITFFFLKDLKTSYVADTEDSL